MRYALILALAVCALAAQALPQAAPRRKIPCKTPEIAASCYWTRGRLNFYNGNPSYRIWKIGTKRILGVYSGPSAFPPRTSQDSENPEIPPNLGQAYYAEYERQRALKNPDAGLPEPVFGDFEVCPLEPERESEMQAVCIEAVKNIFIEKLPPPRR